MGNITGEVFPSKGIQIIHKWKDVQVTSKIQIKTTIK